MKKKRQACTSKVKYIENGASLARFNIWQRPATPQAQRHGLGESHSFWECLTSVIINISIFHVSGFMIGQYGNNSKDQAPINLSWPLLDFASSGISFWIGPALQQSPDQPLNRDLKWGWHGVNRRPLWTTGSRIHYAVPCGCYPCCDQRDHRSPSWKELRVTEWKHGVARIRTYMCFWRQNSTHGKRRVRIVWVTKPLER